MDGVNAQHMYADTGRAVCDMQNPFRTIVSLMEGILIYSTVTATTPDGLPHIGSVPCKRNQYILAGFNGHGMPVIFLAAKGIAAMLRDEKISFEQTGIPRVFKTTRDRISHKMKDES